MRRKAEKGCNGNDDRDVAAGGGCCLRINTNFLIIFIGLVAVAMMVMAIALIVVAVTLRKAIKGLTETANELKGKVLPLIDSATEISRSAQSLLTDTAPKVKHITDTLVDASDLEQGGASACSSSKRRLSISICAHNGRWREWTEW